MGQMPDSPRARRRVFALAASAHRLGLLAPSRPTAALAFTPCQPAGYECGTLGVPLDRTGAVPGQVTLNIKRAVAASNPNRVAVVALAGGPGQAAVPLAQDFATLLGPALASRDLLTFDQRGTGGSTRLRCSALTSSSSASGTDAVRSCAQQLGPSRGFYRTVDSVADLEALRQEAGYEKLVLFGVSYGTKVAEAYASAYPDRVESLVLDSVVTPEGPDAFERSSLAATPRILDQLCANSLCSGITSSASADLAKLTVKLRKASLKGTVYSGSARGFRARLTENGLSQIILTSDLNPAIRAQVPAAMRSALLGDPQPLLRISARTNGLSNAAVPRAGFQSDDDISQELFLATVCEESQTLPWARDATTQARIDQAEAAAKALAPGSTGPFSTNTALVGSYIPQCVGWPNASPAPVADAPLPPAPALIIDGQQDFRTPVEDASGVAARIGPSAQLLPVPNVGHSTTSADPTTCSADAIAAFFGGTPVAQCPADSTPRYAPTPRAPRTFAGLKPYSGVRGTAGRTVQAVRLTANDARIQYIAEALTTGTESPVGGLRGGAAGPGKGGIRLVRYAVVPGVTLSGTLKANGTSTFTVAGSKAARGTLRISSGLRVTGRLGGKRVSTRFGGSAAASIKPFGGLTVEQAIARGKRIRALG